MNGINTFNQFVTIHSSQLIASDVPKHLWETLYHKLENDIFDAGSSFSMYLIDYGDENDDDNRNEEDPIWTLCVSKENGIKANDPNEIYLIDHAWTFQLNQIKDHLNSYPQLITRLSSIMGISQNQDNGKVLDDILRLMWKYCQFYTLKNLNVSSGGGAGDSINDERWYSAVWYIMDEIGCAINQSNNSNFRCIPFFYVPKQITYSLLFPIKNCEDGEQVTRDYLKDVPNPYEDLSNEDFTQKEPSTEYFLTDRTNETLPKNQQTDDDNSTEQHRNLPLKVFAEYEVVKNSLTATEFQIVDTADDADILWTIKHFKDYENFSIQSPKKFINQFPYENVITVKDLLSIVCRRACEHHHDPKTLQTHPIWLPTTYNLRIELKQFISYYQNRHKRHLDNHWIIKPYNLARGLDQTITNNLTQIICISQTGPKIIQKYCERPVLFHRNDINAKVKFDIRYVIVLKSVRPLKLFTYKKFFLRFANKEFSLNDFYDYEKHFTVMNYKNDSNLHRIEYDEFIEKWNEQYGNDNCTWDKIEIEIHKIFKELFECAIKYEPPISIGQSKQSRAIYAADLILNWENSNDACNDSCSTYIQPKLLEINWMPDCKRAAEYYPEFFNEIFKFLFLNEAKENFNEIS